MTEHAYTNKFLIETELAEFYTKNKEGKGSGFGRRLIELYADLKHEKRNKQLLTALRSAKRIIKIWYDKAHGDMGQYFWDEYEQKLFMQRINKAIKDGK